MRAPSTTARARAGFTLLELALSSSLLLLLVGSLALALRRASETTRAGTIQVELQTQAGRALQAIHARLERSGFVVDGAGRSLPFLFSGGVPSDATFAAHAHATPGLLTGAAGLLAADFHAVSREVVFLLPADFDNDADASNGLVPDGRPDIDATGDLVWDLAEHAFVVVDGPDGVRRLEERVDGGAPRPIAHFVDRIECTSTTEDPTGVPLGTLHVRLWLHALDGEGVVHPLRVEQLVRLENGG